MLRAACAEPELFKTPQVVTHEDKNNINRITTTKNSSVFISSVIVRPRCSTTAGLLRNAYFLLEYRSIKTTATVHITMTRAMKTDSSRVENKRMSQYYLKC